MAFGPEALSPLPGAVEVTRHLHLLHPAVCDCFEGGLPADWAPQASLPGGLLVGSAGRRPAGVKAGVALVPLSSLLLPLACGLAGRQCHSGPSSMLPAPGGETPALCLQVGYLVSCHCDPTQGKVWALGFSSSLGHLTFSFLLSQCLCMPFTMLNLLCVEDLV